MGANQSKDELLYQQVNCGYIEGIKALRREGAGLEWIDKEGKTPLIIACMRPDLLHVAKALIEMGANVNAYRPGSHAGTPLHHAAKRGLDSTVILLLSHGANPIVMNDDCQTPLDLSRAKGYASVVRVIENSICLFSGWLREINGPSILEAFAPQWVSKKIYAVVLPCDFRNPQNPWKFELVIYPDLQVSEPRTIIPLWKSQIEDIKFSQPDPALIILDTTRKARFKFLSAHEGDKQQMQWLFNACRGICQRNNAVAPPPPPPPPEHWAAAGNPNPEDARLSMAINASIQTAFAEGIPPPDPTNGWRISPENGPPIHNGWGPSNQTEAAIPVSVPSAPPISDDGAAAVYGGLIRYPSIDSGPIDFTAPQMEAKDGGSGGGGSSSASSLCVICLDAPVEGACIPCGHMAGCMSCLKEIKEKKGECPVCRAHMTQILRLYAV